MTAEPDKPSPPERDAWLQAYLPRLRAFVRARLDPTLQRRESPSDVVQSVCREYLEQGERLEDRGESAFRGWLFTAAINKVRKKARFHMQPRRSLHREDSAPGSDVPAATAHGDRPVEAALARERITILEAALATLSASDRDIIVRTRLTGTPIDEVAAALGKNLEATRKQLGRALVRLSAELERRHRSGAAGG